jgi:pilus assembly protein CpaF
MFTVTILEKGGTERQLTFDKEEVSIGRISGNDIILPKGNISKRHARIVVKDNKFIVIDLKSTNGTYVNKERIHSPRVIDDGDKIYVGDFVMKLAAGDAVEAAADMTAKSDIVETQEHGLAEMDSPEEAIRPTEMGAPLIDEEAAEEATRALDVDDIEIIEEFVEVEVEVEPLDEVETSSSDISAESSDLIDVEIETGEQAAVASEVEFDLIEAEELDAELIEVSLEDEVEDSAVMEDADEAEALVEVELEDEVEPQVADESQDNDSAAEESPVEESPVEESPVEESPVEESPVEESPVEGATEEPADDDDNDDEDFGHYVGVLEFVAEHVEQKVFAGLQRDTLDLDDDEEWAKLEQQVSEVIEAVRSEGDIPDEYETSLLTQDMLYEFTGLGPIEYFLADDSVSEVLVNDYQQIFVTHNGTTDIVWKSYSSPAALDRAVDELANSVGLDSVSRPPIITGDLPDGTAFRILLPPLAPDGPVLTFTKAPTGTYTIQSLLEGGALAEEMAEYLFEHIVGGANVLVSGRRQVDRIQVMNALALLIPEDERVVLLEALGQVVVPHRNCIRLRLPTLFEESEQLFAVIPTLGTERLVVADVLGDNIAAVLRLGLEGAEGVLASTYGRSPQDLARRIEAFVEFAGVESAETLLAGSVDVIVHVEAAPDGLRITSISEVDAGEEGLQITEVFGWSSDDTGEPEE